MKQSKGVLHQGQEKIIYIQNDFRFDLITSRIGEFYQFFWDIIPYNKELSDDQHTIIKPTDHFIHGQEETGCQIAIYADTDIEILGSKQIFSPLYISGTEKNLTDFQAIEFVGGTLNKLLNLPIPQLSNSSDTYAITLSKIEYRYVANFYKQPCQIKIYTYPDNNGILQVHMRYECESNQSLSEIINFLKVTQQLVRFMSRRKNIGFDLIKLYSKNNYFAPFATCYLYYDATEWTNRSANQNITFEDLNDCLPNLINLLQHKDKQETCLFNFIPDDDKKIRQIDNECIKNICASLEHEIAIAKLEINTDELLNQIKKELKEIIKKYKNDPKLSKDNYNSLHAQIRYINHPLKERIKIFYQSFEDVLFRLKLNNIDFKLEDINDFIDYRNDIVHGEFRVRTPAINNTAWVMMALIYCSILRRIGISDEKLKEMMGHDKFIL